MEAIEREPYSADELLAFAEDASNWDQTVSGRMGVDVVEYMLPVILRTLADLVRQIEPRVPTR